MEVQLLGQGLCITVFFIPIAILSAIPAGHDTPLEYASLLSIITVVK